MEAKLLHSLTTNPPFPRRSASGGTRHPIFSPVRRLQPLKLGSTRKSSPGNANETEPESDAATPRLQVTPPPETVEVRFRRRSSRRRPRQTPAEEPKAGMSAPAREKKKWEDMSVAEKAAELYVGEKGALYWLNKLAYASIFVVIGGWIAFRFVGPALNLYQLDSPPLAPDAIFKGSS